MDPLEGSHECCIHVCEDFTLGVAFEQALKIGKLIDNRMGKRILEQLALIKVEV